MTSEVASKSVSNSGRPRNRRCLQLSIDLLYWMGLLPKSEHEKHNKLYYLRSYYPVVTIVRMLYSMVFHLISLLGVLGDIQLMAEFFITGVIHFHVMVRMLTLYYYREEVKVILDTIERLHQPAMLHDKQMRAAAAAVERKTAYFTKYLLGTFTIGCCLCMTFIAIHGLSTRTLPFRRFLPYNYHYTPVFEATIICIQVLQTIDFCFMAVFELTCVALMMLIIKQFELLQYKLQHIRHHVDIKLSRRRQEAVSRVRQGVRSLRVLQVAIQKSDVTLGEIEKEVEEQEKRENREQQELESWAVGGAEVEFPAVEDQEDMRNPAICDDKDVGSPVYCDNKDVRIPAICDDKDVRNPIYCDDKDVRNPASCDHNEGSDGRGEQKTSKDDQESEHMHTAVKTSLKKNDDEMQEAMKNAPKVASPETQREMNVYLRHCVRHHESLLWLVKKFCRVFKFTIAVLVLTSALGGIGFIYISTLAPKMDVVVYGIALLMYAMYCTFLMYCWHGNLISEEAMKVRDAAYDCDWFGSSPGFKATLRIIIARCERPLLIKGAGLTLSVKNFRLIMRSAFYGHNLLSKLFYGEKISLGRNKST